MYELKIAENNRLTAELKKYMSALKEETAKRSEATDMVKIPTITKQSESKIETLMNALQIQDTVSNPKNSNPNAWVTKGKEGGFKQNNTPRDIKNKPDKLVECAPCGKDYHEK